MKDAEYSEIELRTGYHQLKIKPEDTTLRGRYEKSCRSSLCWKEAGKIKILETELIQQTKETKDFTSKRLVKAQDEYS